MTNALERERYRLKRKKRSRKMKSKLRNRQYSGLKSLKSRVQPPRRRLTGLSSLGDPESVALCKRVPLPVPRGRIGGSPTGAGTGAGTACSATSATSSSTFKNHVIDFEGIKCTPYKSKYATQNRQYEMCNTHNSKNIIV